jgi:hypothetical protein
MSDYVSREQFERFLKEETDHHQRFEEAGDKRGREISEISGKLDSIIKWRAIVDRKLDKHNHTLFGNGEPGWDEKLRRLVAFVDKQEAKEAAGWSEVKKFTIGIIAFIVNTLLTILITRLLG